jgi:hypothetical protein
MEPDDGITFIGTATVLHYGDYGVFRDPLERFVSAATEADVQTEVRVVGRSETAPMFAHQT